MCFLDVFAGFPGSVNDIRLLKNSALYSSVECGLILNGAEYGQGSFSIREFIVADGGYPLLPWLMIPYTTPTIATEKLFNYKLSSIKIVVERAFGILKMRWRYLLGNVMKPCPQNLSRAIVVCCMLQNMCLENGAAMGDDMDSCEAHVSGGDAPQTHVGKRSSSLTDAPTADALAIRDLLAKFLHPS
ncbi:hypothetical protein L7F22_012829 [Adiantum nelumboides]|nr:hypothetical protein [Adiantum nelumboides]